MSIPNTAPTAETPHAPPTLMPIMTPAEVMAWLKIKRTKLYNLIDQGLPYHALSPSGRTKVFYPAEVQAWLDARGRSRVAPATVPEPTTSRRGRPRKDAEQTTSRWAIKR